MAYLNRIFLALFLTSTLCSTSLAKPKITSKKVFSTQKLDELVPVFINNPKDECSPINSAEFNPLIHMKATKLLNILKRTPLTEKLAQQFYLDQGVVCFVDMSSSTTEALYFNDLIILNSAAEEGCLIHALIHELHHGLQKNHGLKLGHNEQLGMEAQFEYVFTKEVDSHVIQVLGSWMLASNEYSSQPYSPARSCLEDDKHNVFPYLATAMRSTVQISNDPATRDWIDNGRLAKKLFDQLSTEKELEKRYYFSVSMAYACLLSPDCLFGTKTLVELDLDPKIVGTIHFRDNYLEIEDH